ncbi:MAG: Fe-S oxidoreductase [Candidatus Beckwithbacteria bacterium GW2011_GWA2_43_10]|uniref:Fe-S oxidoreductase n=1 Tax=Candidatus Beckwithbacteria bacterium GW2011_GWA2_43_10 TaxID=1618369 RepID=A0A0G1EZI9_9BACT|nr:MAG: Fe-S oxidoreductase [Candidatus Beckwithbacteria bacterium GW2011_GWA2_43_10]
MKICIGYPPLKSKNGVPLLSQNRQFQWFKSPTYIYPVIPASAATLLQSQGHQVVWLDGIAENWTYNQWFNRLKAAQPDLLFMETKTPVIKQHWRIIKDLKRKGRILPNLKIVLAGDHVTALPKETLNHCPVDYLIKGGHYDLSLLALVNRLKEKGYELPKKFVTFATLPFIDRELTRWQLYAYKNGNFKYPPGTYTMAGRDCWWRQNGGCTFCSWTTLFPKFMVRTPQSLLDEIGQLIKLGVKEVFDDTGTFMAGDWLTQFCQGMIKRGYNKKISFGCNMRFGVLTAKDYQLMAKANFRFLLFGLESASQTTLDRLNKGIKIDQVEPELKIIKKTKKLEPHVTCMVGYPWESLQDAQNTVNFTKNLFKKNLISSLQATIIIPYPGTKLFQEAKKNHWLKTTDWNKYDMAQPILKSSIPDKKLMALTRNIYLSCLTPQFILKKILSLRSPADYKFLIRSARQFIGQILDFSLL